MQEKVYVTPELEIIEFDTEDIITNSGESEPILGPDEGNIQP